jgi:hypothetical protein
MIEILNPDDLSLLDGAVIPDLEAGQTSGVVPFALRATENVSDVLAVIEALDPDSGRWLQTGLPPLDELWPQLRITGPGTPIDWTPVGASHGLWIANLTAGVVLLGELRMRPPATAAAVTWQFRLAVVAAEHSRPVPRGTRTGVLTGLSDAGHSAVVSGLRVNVSEPADDQVHISPGRFVLRGRLRGQVTTAVTLDVNDGAGEPLAAGEAYWAVLSAGGAGVTVTKGLRATVPERPAPPAWEPPLAAVQVRETGGSPEIEATDVEDLTVYDRHAAEAGTGLQLRVHPGQTVGGGTWRFHSVPVFLALPASATRWLWQRTSGAWELTDDSAAAPETTALGPLWQITTDTDAVTELVDLRTYAADTVVLHLRGTLPGVPGEIASQLVAHDGLILEEVLYRLADNGGGASGQTQLDLEVAGATVYTSNATDDQRPAWPFDAGELVISGRIHEVTELRPRDALRLISLEHPAGGAPAWAEAYLICRRTS